jgi:predicted RNA binding protein YcfA (HicA-like mRNA interferase family)
VPKQPAVNAGKLIKFLNRLGYRFVRQKGSHHILEKIGDNGKKLSIVAVPYHGSNKLPTGLVHDIIRQVSEENGIPRDALIEMLERT